MLTACCELECEGQGLSARPHGSNKVYTNEREPRTTKTSRGAERPTTCNFSEDAWVPDLLEHVQKEHTEPTDKEEKVVPFVLELDNVPEEERVCCWL